MSILALSFAFLLGLILVGIGYPAVVWLDSQGRLKEPERLLAAFCLGALFLHFAVSAIGHVQLNAVTMRGLGLALLLLAVPGWRRIDWRQLADAGKALPRLPLLLLGAICLSSFLQGLAPPNDYDSLMYHLATPKADIERGVIAPDWMRGISNVFFPHLITSIIRFTLAAFGEPAAQPSVALFGLAGAAGTGLLAVRLGLSWHASLWAAIMFSSIRMIVWQMGTVEVDIAIATVTVTLSIVYLASRNGPDLRLSLLFGLLLGVGFNIKYQGGLVALSFAPILLVDLLRGRTNFLSLAAMAAVALAVFAPHMAENYLLTGDPVFPLYFSKIVHGGAPFYDTYHLGYGSGRGLIDLIIEPWLIFVAPMQYFDGMVMGAPYLMALLPAAFIGWRKLRGAASLIVLMAVYYLLWFYVQSQQVRFLSPIFPALCVLAATGACFLLEYTRERRWLNWSAKCLLALLFLNQSLFVGIYAAIRLPVAVGLMTPSEYNQRTPTLQGASFDTCRFISDRLGPDEWYLSFIAPHSYFCPQLHAIQNYFEDEKKDWLFAEQHHKIGFADFLSRLEEKNIKFVAVTTSVENRRNTTGEAVRVEALLDDTRFGPFIQPALRGLTPLFSAEHSEVYDGKAVLLGMRAMLERGDYPKELR